MLHFFATKGTVYKWAELIKRMTGATGHEIEPVSARPDDYVVVASRIVEGTEESARTVGRCEMYKCCLEQLWDDTQHTPGRSWTEVHNRRSSTVGDVFVVNGRWWMVAGTGFAPLDAASQDAFTTRFAPDLPDEYDWDTPVDELPPITRVSPEGAPAAIQVVGGVRPPTRREAPPAGEE